MNFLLMLSAYGIPLPDGSDASEIDFNNNGFIDYSDILEMLSMQPTIEEFGLYEEK